DLQGADQRLLHRLGHAAESTLVVAAFEHMNFCEWHLKVSLSCESLSRRRPTLVEPSNAIVDQRVQRRHARGADSRIERKLCLLPGALSLCAFGTSRARGLYQTTARVLTGALSQPALRQQRLQVARQG